MSEIWDAVCVTKTIVKQYRIQWRIENFKHIQFDGDKKLESGVFLTGKNQVKWALSLSETKPDKCGKQHISFFIELKSAVKLSVSYKVSIVLIPFCHKSGKQIVNGPGSCAINELFSRGTTIGLDNGALLIDLVMDVVEDIINSTETKIVADLNHISEDIGNLLNSSLMSDFVIIIGNRKFYVHKVILASRSPVFAAMFQHDFKETKTNALRLNDISPHVMESVIKYIYSGKFDGLEEKATEILPVAEKYGLRHLKAMSEYVLCSQLEVDNVLSILCLADTYSAQRVKERCINMICANYSHIFKTSEWKSMVRKKEMLALEIKDALFDDSLLGKSIHLSGIP